MENQTPEQNEIEYQAARALRIARHKDLLAAIPLHVSTDELKRRMKIAGDTVYGKGN